MKIIKKVILLSATLPVLACTDPNTDKIELSYSFEKKEKKINLVLFNNTNEDFIVIISKTFNFDSKHSGSEKLEEYTSLNADLSNPENTVFSKQIDSINLSLNPSASPEDMKASFPTAVLVKKKEKKQLEYKFNNNFTVNREYKTSFGKMRDILNIPYNLEMLKKMLECRQDDQYKIYLDDFAIKDSIKVKF
ncbi:hypothetical protein [Chryseobacterium pennipullorum]|uniref:Lipoprotein n=1 Tax=Chryseobacterium pennipullorum TaxID=2258963 RepID=A0A3D9B6P4_9FLAO|nr:hypothetical protein [Chryseobacterium pennipullorum]REC49018.1 hypothetical protein DRF67_05525 [Chryseobacterium pennipullorum]